jgi:hypothetical protein
MSIKLLLVILLLGVLVGSLVENVIEARANGELHRVLRACHGSYR